MSCLIMTPKIRELAKKFPKENEDAILNLVGMWQEKNNKSPEDIPLGSELNAFIQELRKPKEQKGINKTEDRTETTETQENKAAEIGTTISVRTIQEVNLLFDPQVRRDRVTLISRLFSNEIDILLEEEKKKLSAMIESAKTQQEKDELNEQLENLNRISIIKKVKPKGIFDRVYSMFSRYVNLTEEDRIQQELDKINSKKGAEKYTDEQKKEAAKKKATYKLREYKKLVDDPSVFAALTEEAGTLLVFTEGIKIDPNYSDVSDVNFKEVDPEGKSDNDPNDADWEQETAYKDGWMTNFREVSSHESLSQEVRKAIMKVPKLGYNGKVERDDLGFPRYLDANYVHAALIDGLRFMINSDDMIPLLQDMAKNKTWVKQIINLLQKDEKLFSQFYQDFKKDFINYWIQKMKPLPDGTFKIETVSINKPEGIYYLLDAWRDNYESGTPLDDDSVYNEGGSINIENAKKGLKIVENLNNEFNKVKTTEERLKLLERDDIWNSLIKTLHMIGINPNPSILEKALNNIHTVPGIQFTDPIMLLIPQLNIIYRGIIKGEIKDELDSEGNIVRKGDLINTFGSAYNSIALMLAEVTDDAIESSVRENGKSYYSHVTPSYLGKLIKNLKNVRNNKERFLKFLEDEFKKSDWFYDKDTNTWLNTWLRLLEESDEFREGLNHKVVLNSNKKEYSEWDELDYTIALLAEYWAEPESSKSSVNYAWYHVPILSDAPSAEFIRFRKYTTGDILDSEGNIRTYDDVILDEMVNTVLQEYNRIMKIRERSRKYQNGDTSIEPIANYDITYKDGKINNIGGAEFKFFPTLNTIKYDNGETFIERIGRIKKEGTGEDLREMIRGTLYAMMENEFEKTFKEWVNIGLLDELPNGKYKHLSWKIQSGQSKQNAFTIKAMNKAKVLLGNLFNTEMELLLKDLENNRYINDVEASELLEQIKVLLFDKANRKEIDMKDAESVSKSLFIRNNAKDALREYFWNSKLATSQIIELTTTDLAFYKNIEDFQKRFKEIHSPSLRLNTKATYKGELVGREFEKTIYIRDNIVESASLEDIKKVLDNNRELSEIDKDYILSQFKKVNVADAQAYRSLSSYRAVLVMSGQWTDEMEQAYKNLKEGTWNIKDFSIIWQTKKPFVYTQVFKDSGIEGSTPIKVPVQHKNSEFLLLAMYDAMSNSLGKSHKLRAINKFMEKYNIDVVQFESTTKVGGQGIIDLNGLDIEEEIIKKLEKDTGLGSNNENPNVVHTIPYEDYGIQTPTPEHGIDATQLIGTQIRKLITADISDDAIIEVDGRKKTKKEWLDLYNEITTENILQSFLEVKKLFKDKKEIEKALLDEVRSNPRYGVEMRRACTLDEDGNFNIPLFDPIQSQMVQTLLNSIIRNRITKQKIRGGALIQVSDYGMTDELQIVWEGEGENKRIEYLECYMPAYSRKFYEPLMDPKTHQLDVNKLPEGLRRLIGYRVPTEDKYSMVPLRIKGFLPQQNGSAIMLPAEITTLSGSDFDKLNVEVKLC